MERIKLLQVSVDPGEEDSELQIPVDGKEIKYLTVKAGVYEPEDMCFEPAIVPMLPPLPKGHWVSGTIARDSSNGQPHFASLSADPLTSVTHTWHDHQIDYLQLSIGKKLRSNVYKAFDPKLDRNVVLKFARFAWEVDQIDRETEAYSWIRGRHISPEFLGHVTENDRVIGFVMEEMRNIDHAGPEDLARCEKVLKQLHSANILHGDVNRHNFLVGNGRAVLIDFDMASHCTDQSLLTAELNSLVAELDDQSGRGGCVREDPPMPVL